jgi:two-component system chemotaxis response regulator CheB
MRPDNRPQPAQYPDIVAIGASAGGVEAISQLLSLLPSDLPASVLVVLHRPIELISSLRRILARKSKLHVVTPHEGEPLRPGVCYLGEPDKHLTIGPHSRLHLLADGFYRAHSIDALFWSLARHAGNRTIGVILSGLLKDGSFGLKAIREAGGIVLVQSPEEAACREMPESAIRYDGPIHLIAPIDVLASEICRLTGYTPELRKVLKRTA